MSGAPVPLLEAAIRRGELRDLNGESAFYPPAKVQEAREPSKLPPTNDSSFQPAPVDWEALDREGIPTVEMLAEPYIPAGARIWAFGPAESGKSLFAAGSPAS